SRVVVPVAAAVVALEGVLRVVLDGAHRAVRAAGEPPAEVQDEDVQEREGEGERDVAVGDRGADGAGGPQRGGRGQPADVARVLDDGAGADEADAGRQGLQAVGPAGRVPGG